MIQTKRCREKSPKAFAKVFIILISTCFISSCAVVVAKNDDESFQLEDQDTDHFFDLNSPKPQIKHYKNHAGSVMVKRVSGEEGNRLVAFNMDPIFPPYTNVRDSLPVVFDDDPTSDENLDDHGESIDNHTNNKESHEIGDHGMTDEESSAKNLSIGLKQDDHKNTKEYDNDRGSHEKSVQGDKGQISNNIVTELDDDIKGDLMGKVTQNDASYVDIKEEERNVQDEIFVSEIQEELMVEKPIPDLHNDDVDQSDIAETANLSESDIDDSMITDVDEIENNELQGKPSYISEMQQESVTRNANNAILDESKDTEIDSEVPIDHYEDNEDNKITFEDGQAQSNEKEFLSIQNVSEFDVESDQDVFLHGENSDVADSSGRIIESVRQDTDRLSELKEDLPSLEENQSIEETFDDSLFQEEDRIVIQEDNVDEFNSVDEQMLQKNVEDKLDVDRVIRNDDVRDPENVQENITIENEAALLIDTDKVGKVDVHESASSNEGFLSSSSLDVEDNDILPADSTANDNSEDFLRIQSEKDDDITADEKLKSESDNRTHSQGIEDAYDNLSNTLERPPSMDTRQSDTDVVPSSANHEFVAGLDDIHKFFEDVDPPDELDPGAGGYSLEEVIKSQGIQIIKTRLNKGIQLLRGIIAKLRDQIDVPSLEDNERIVAVKEFVEQLKEKIVEVKEDNIERIEIAKEFANSLKEQFFDLKEFLIETIKERLENMGISGDDDFEYLYDEGESEDEEFIRRQLMDE